MELTFKTYCLYLRAIAAIKADPAAMARLGALAVRLEGVAEYQLVGRPYRRRVTFHVEPGGGAYRVSEMELGEVLTDLPDIFQGAE